MLCGFALMLVQWGLERGTFVAILTDRLAQGVLVGLHLLGVPATLDGLVLHAGTLSQPVSASCLGLIAVTGYLSGLLAVPADWTTRWRGIRRDLPLLVLGNVIRLVALGVLITVSVSAFQFAHAILMGAVAPLALIGLWGFWFYRDLGALSAYPWRFVRDVALALPLAIGLWWLLLYPYAVGLLAVIKAALSGLVGMPIVGTGVAEDGFKRLLDFQLPDGGFRIEMAGRSLALAPLIALIGASPIPWTKRIGLGGLGLAIQFGLHALEVVGLVLLGRIAPPVVSAVEALSDYVALASGPFLWLLLAAPSSAWWALEREGRRARSA